ncbi:MAG: hypothetical protein MHMPM18_000250 [Marteilia pararefringens]
MEQQRDVMMSEQEEQFGDSPPLLPPTTQRSNEDEDEEPNDDENEDEFINVDMSIPDSDFGDDLLLIKFPNFINIESKPFNPSNYEELKPSGNDEESLANFYVACKSCIRCRYKKDDRGQLVFDEIGDLQLESNARFVEWSDGTHSLYVGEEIYDIHYIDNQYNFSQLFVKQSSGLYAQGPFKKKIMLRTFNSKTSDFHPALKAQNIAFKKAKVIPTIMSNPDISKEQMIKQEELDLKQASKRTSHIKLNRSQLTDKNQSRSSHDSFGASYQNSSINSNSRDDSYQYDPNGSKMQSDNLFEELKASSEEYSEDAEEKSEGSVLSKSKKRQLVRMIEESD